MKTRREPKPTPATYRHCICAACGQHVTARWTPGHVWVGDCGHEWRENVWLWRAPAQRRRR